MQANASPRARPHRGVRIGVGAITLAVVLGATAFTLGTGLVLKAHCAAGAWKDGRQYRVYCYSDVPVLYRSEHLSGNRLPYLDSCEGIVPCDEYPPVTMYFLRATAWLSGSSTSFFWVTAAALSALGLLTSWLLFRLAGARALLFALSPTLLLYGFMNWDLLPVALSTAATLLFLRRRDGWAGLLLGLGIAAKLYPALALVAFLVHRVRERRRRAAVVLAATAVGAWAAVNVPFMATAFGPWSYFFRFNAGRTADWDSLWFAGCTRFVGALDYCPWAPKVIGEIGVVAFVAVVGVAWWTRRRRNPDFPRWELGFLFIAAALLTSKVYSPQYSLWLLPWFALVGVRPWLFAGFQAAEVAVFLTRFSWFGRLFHDLGRAGFASYHGVPIGAFEITVLIRDALLLLAIVLWARREPLPEGRRLTLPRLERRRVAVGQGA
jgi:hypothetical protein